MYAIAINKRRELMDLILNSHLFDPSGPCYLNFLQKKESLNVFFDLVKRIKVAKSPPDMVNLLISFKYDTSYWNQQGRTMF